MTIFRFHAHKVVIYDWKVKFIGRKNSRLNKKSMNIKKKLMIWDRGYADVMELMKISMSLVITKNNS